MRDGCGFPKCTSSACHNPYDTHFLCTCGWVGYVHSRHVSCMEVLSRPRDFRSVRRQHKVVARQRLRRTPLRVVA